MNWKKKKKYLKFYCFRKPNYLSNFYLIFEGLSQFFFFSFYYLNFYILTIIYWNIFFCCNLNDLLDNFRLSQTFCSFSLILFLISLTPYLCCRCCRKLQKQSILDYKNKKKKSRNRELQRFICMLSLRGVLCRTSASFFFLQLLLFVWLVKIKVLMLFCGQVNFDFNFRDLSLLRRRNKKKKRGENVWYQFVNQ